MHQHRDKGRFVIGAFIIIVGILALLDNLNIFDTGRILQFWPTAFIVLGGVKLLRAHSPRGLLAGGTLIGIGVVWTLQNAGYLHFHLREWWPVFLILAGLMVLSKGRSRSRRCRVEYAGEHHHGIEDCGVIDKDFLETSAIMSGQRLKSDAKAFRGGDVTAIMGGLQLDLRQALIESEATLRVTAFWGGVEIAIPPDWVVVSEAVPFLGGIDDKSVAPQHAAKRLIITGHVIMGGVEIKN